MPPKQVFGAPTPRKRVLVRVQSYTGSRVTSTVSYSLIGHKMSDVTNVVEKALNDNYADAEEDVEVDTVSDSESIASKPRLKLKKRRA